MNTLRVWGGGIFEYDAFFDAADTLGILLYHDMMYVYQYWEVLVMQRTLVCQSRYAQQGHAPAVTPEQDAELRYQVRRLASQCVGTSLKLDVHARTHCLPL